MKAESLRTSSFSARVLVMVSPMAGTVIRYRYPYWSDAMIRPFGSKVIDTHEPSSCSDGP